MADDELTEQTLTLSLDAEAAERGAILEVEPIEGGWSAGFVVKDAETGQAVLLQVTGPDRATALLRLREEAEKQA